MEPETERRVSWKGVFQEKGWNAAERWEKARAEK